ncbi:MAG TPA: hypothetical protein VNQ76_03315, partial [Planctomicrobium sp.]|nr:hypothetical protein [Planctomicrobium sp.]
MSRTIQSGCLIVILSGLLAGCGAKQDGPQRFSVSGTVTYKGEPIPRGTVTISPNMAKGNEGPVGIAQIINGKYDTNASGAKSPIAGELLIQVDGYGPANPNEEVPTPLFKSYVLEMSLPEKS